MGEGPNDNAPPDTRPTGRATGRFARGLSYATGQRRFRRVQALVREGSPLVKLRNFS